MLGIREKDLFLYANVLDLRIKRTELLFQREFDSAPPPLEKGFVLAVTRSI